MSELNHSYPFDPTGSNLGNRISEEKHALSPPAWKDYHFIIPKLAPFFRDSVTIKDLETGRILVEGVDWVATHRFTSASRATAKPVYGSITFYDKILSGIIEITYQTLGGDWVIAADHITEILVHKKSNPRITTWEQVADIPYQFPPIDHQWHLSDMVGMSDVKDAIDNIAQKILETKDIGPYIDGHINSKQNPHDVTKHQVGLGQVEDYPVATRADALDGVSDEAYMTPRRTRQAIEYVAGAYTEGHTNDTDNPHNVTKEQVELGKVENFGLPSEEEAVDGISHEHYMTPVRTKDAITKQVKEPFDLHKNSKDNPHEVTKGQVGLHRVENYSPATRVQSITGERNDLYMTPYTTREAIEFVAFKHTNDAVNALASDVFTKEEIDDKLYQLNQALSVRITNLEDVIPLIMDSISANTQLVVSLTSRVEENERMIPVLLQSINSNAEAILSLEETTPLLEQAINHNASLIAALTERVNSNETAIPQLLESITSNTEAIMLLMERADFNDVASLFNAHISLRNSHSVTKDQVGLGSVDNKNYFTIDSAVNALSSEIPVP